MDYEDEGNRLLRLAADEVDGDTIVRVLEEAVVALRLSPATAVLADALRQLGNAYGSIHNHRDAAHAFAEASHIALSGGLYTLGLSTGRYAHVHSVANGGSLRSALIGMQELKRIAAIVPAPFQVAGIYYSLGQLLCENNIGDYGRRNGLKALQVLDTLPVSSQTDSARCQYIAEVIRSVRKRNSTGLNPLTLLPKRFLDGALSRPVGDQDTPIDLSQVAWLTHQLKDFASERKDAHPQLSLQVFLVAQTLDVRYNYETRDQNAKGWDKYTLGCLYAACHENIAAFQSILESIQIYSSNRSLMSEIPDCINVLLQVARAGAWSRTPTSSAAPLLQTLQILIDFAVNSEERQLNAACSQSLGSILLSYGECEKAVKHFNNMLALTPERDLAARVSGLNGLASALLGLQVPAQALACYELMDDLSTEPYYPFGLASASRGRALCLLALGPQDDSFARVEPLCKSAARLFHGLGQRSNSQLALRDLANYYERAGQPAEARKTWQRVRAVCIRVKADPWDVLSCDINISRLFLAGPTLIGERERRALDFAVPTLMQAERLRHQFESFEDRAQWRERCDTLWKLVFEWASMLEDDSMLAELIDWKLNANQFNSKMSSAAKVSWINDITNTISANFEMGLALRITTPEVRSSLRSSSPPPLANSANHKLLLSEYELSAERRYDFAPDVQTPVALW